MFAERDALVRDELIANASESVVYARGATTATVSAVIGRTDEWGADSGATHDRYESRDFLVKVSALTAFTLPADGDTITDSVGEWVLDSPGGKPHPFDYSDAARSVYRLHAWRGRG